MKSSKKPIFLLVNDLHLKKDNCELVYNIFQQVVSVCNNMGIDRVVIGGDMFTNRSGQPLSVLLACKRCFEMLCDNNIITYVIPGNHDKTDVSDDRSYLDVFQRDGINVINRPKYLNFGGVGVFLMPYYTESIWIEKFNSFLKNKTIKDKSILVTHIAINGVKNNDGTLVSDGISEDWLDMFDQIFVGHYHNRSDVGKKIHYTGSAYQNNFGEDIEKGFTVVYDDLSWMNIDSVFPKYIVERVEASDNVNLHNVLERYDNSDDNVRIIINGSKVECDKINVSEIRDKYGVDVKVQTNEEIEAIEISNNEVIRFDKMSIKKDFIRFCAENKIRGKEFNFGLNLIKSM